MFLFTKILCWWTDSSLASYPNFASKGISTAMQTLRRAWALKKWTDLRDPCLMYLHLPLKKNQPNVRKHLGPGTSWPSMKIRGWLSIFGWFWNSLLNRECLDFTIPIHFKKVGFRYQDLDEFLDGVSLMWSWYTCPKDPLWPYNWSEWTCFFTVWGSGIPDVRHCFPALNWDAENRLPNA